MFTGRAAINHGFYLTPWNVPNKPLLDDNIVRVKGVVQHADNLPTILEYFPQREGFRYAHLPGHNRYLPTIPTEFDGQSLLPVVPGERSARSEIVVESREHRAYLAPPWKLIWHKDGGEKLFNLQNDPLELNDRTEQEKAIREQLSEKLRCWVEKNLREERTDPIFATDGAWTCYIGSKRGR